MFKAYPKLHRLGKDETDSILFGKVHIQEKLDGANASIWLEDGQLKCGSRTRELESGFNGFVSYVKDLVHCRFDLALHQKPSYRLYGEWLVRHTIHYNELAYKKFYLFDIYDHEHDRWLTVPEVIAFGTKFDIPMPKYHGEFEFPSLELIQSFVGKSELGEVGEGVVLKRDNFVNKFGDMCYAKVVTQQFKENNAIVFGGNNKHSETYWEMYIVNKYMTLPRIEKIINKIQPTIDKRLDLEHTPRVSNTAYHDMLTEEIWEIQAKVPQVNFKQLKNLSLKKAIKIYHDILNHHISVAYQSNE